jgi:hypothetical protein
MITQVTAELARACCRCGKTALVVRLEKCAICHKFFCRPCAVRRHGKTFCSRECADFFFFGDGEEED